MERWIRAIVLSQFVSQRLRPLTSAESAEDLLFLAELVRAGRVRPVIDRTYPLSKAADAIRYLKEGHARGKVVITV
jgi:NADPH:quinone reductase-like Zn-dependent oxidoreductase